MEKYYVYFYLVMTIIITILSAVMATDRKIDWIGRGLATALFLIFFPALIFLVWKIEVLF